MTKILGGRRYWDLKFITGHGEMKANLCEGRWGFVFTLLYLLQRVMHTLTHGVVYVLLICYFLSKVKSVRQQAEQGALSLLVLTCLVNLNSHQQTARSSGRESKSQHCSLFMVSELLLYIMS